MVLLEVKGLSKSFGGLKVLSAVDLDVDAGQIVGLIGPNGSGKTTLFNTVTGSLKSDGGHVFFKGDEITGLRPYQVCHRGIGRTFQLTRPFVRLTCLENVMVGSLFGNDTTLTLKETKKEAERALSFVGLERKRHVRARSLNTIERKRLELARALATRPQLLLLDEIMAGLNPMEIDTAVKLIREIHNSGVALLIVEHVMKAVLGLSQRVIVLDAGKKIAEGAPREVVRNQEVMRAYFGDNIHA